MQYALLTYRGMDTPESSLHGFYQSILIPHNLLV